MKISSIPLLLLLTTSFWRIAASSSATGWYDGHHVQSATALSRVSFLRTLPNRQSSFRADHEQNGNHVIANGDGHRSNRSAKSLLFTIPRGGDVGPISGHSLAVVVGGLAATDCLFALAPVTMLKWLDFHMRNNKDNPNNVEERKYSKLAYHYVHGIGSSAATITVLFLLRLLSSSTVSLEQALGWSFFVRLLSMTALIVTGQSKDLGMNGKLFDFTWMVLASMTALLLSGYQTDLAMSLTKAVSFLLAIHGYFLYTVPTAFVEKALNKGGGTASVLSKKTATNKAKKVHSVDDDTAALATTINLASVNGGYMAISGAVAYLLAHGLDAVQVAGYVAIGWIPILHRFLHSFSSDNFLGIDNGFWGGVISIVMAVIAIGCLSPATVANVATSPVPPIPVGPPTQPIA